MRKLGLIGGLGPGATVHYYKELVQAKAGEMLIVHADMDRVLGCVQRGERLELAEYFASSGPVPVRLAPRLHFERFRRALEATLKS